MTITTFKGFGGVEPKTVAKAEELDAFDLPGGLALPFRLDPPGRLLSEHWRMRLIAFTSVDPRAR